MKTTNLEDDRLDSWGVSVLPLSDLKRSSFIFEFLDLTIQRFCGAFSFKKITSREGDLEVFLHRRDESSAFFSESEPFTNSHLVKM
jgi:hypothetical protein